VLTLKTRLLFIRPHLLAAAFVSKAIQQAEPRLTTGTVLSNRSNMKLNMSALDLLDMAAYSITGPTTPSVNSEVNYTVRVRNLSPDSGEQL